MDDEEPRSNILFKSFNRFFEEEDLIAESLNSKNFNIKEEYLEEWTRYFSLYFIGTHIKPLEIYLLKENVLKQILEDFGKDKIVIFVKANHSYVEFLRPGKIACHHVDNYFVLILKYSEELENKIKEAKSVYDLCLIECGNKKS